MAARALQLTPLPRPPSTLQTLSRIAVSSTPSKIQSSHGAVLRKTKKIEEQDLYGLPKEYYDDEWQAQQWEKTKELHQRRQEEDEEEERKIDEYREVGMRLKDYPEEEVQKARQLVSSFIKSAEEVEEKIEEAAERGELTELVLMVIWNRLDLARRDINVTCVVRGWATPANLFLGSRSFELEEVAVDAIGCWSLSIVERGQGLRRAVLLVGFEVCWLVAKMRKASVGSRDPSIYGTAYWRLP
ncbi:hypothetical protein HYC85_031240 [Camellia sinensis]|uniref:Uncharacterized protein n=1 Tax=Camellia sinensis TaxID=4442 RepID=A0A7J7FQT4_CAMSI|nr:hypothetical protein HYC85_031240 [Camellia sinensis]